jgi:Flp pilus assembly pilin Flp
VIELLPVVFGKVDELAQGDDRGRLSAPQSRGAHSTGKGARRRHAAMHRIARIIREDRGASAIEYALIAVLIALVAIAVFQLVGPDLISSWL